MSVDYFYSSNQIKNNKITMTTNAPSAMARLFFELSDPMPVTVLPTYTEPNKYYKNKSLTNRCQSVWNDWRFEMLENKITKLEMSGFEPEASYMRSKRSTTELHPHSAGTRHRMSSRNLNLVKYTLKNETAHYWANAEVVLGVRMRRGGSLKTIETIGMKFVREKSLLMN